MQAANPKTQLEIALDGGGSDLDQKSEVNLKQLWEEAKVYPCLEVKTEHLLISNS